MPPSTSRWPPVKRPMVAPVRRQLQAPGFSLGSSDLCYAWSKGHSLSPRNMQTGELSPRRSASCTSRPLSANSAHAASILCCPAPESAPTVDTSLPPPRIAQPAAAGHPLQRLTLSLAPALLSPRAAFLRTWAATMKASLPPRSRQRLRPAHRRRSRFPACKHL
jgi:hypothetical protein